jgi:FKBP-type peptidyl-prolyl cis-trans isomerase
VLESFYERMKKEAANGKVFRIDDTSVRIMELVKENREWEKKEEGKENVKGKTRMEKKKKKEERVEIQTSGVVVELHSECRGYISTVRSVAPPPRY